MNETKLTLKVTIAGAVTEVTKSVDRFDLDIYEMGELFSDVLLAQGFAQSSIDDLFRGEDD